MSRLTIITCLFLPLAIAGCATSGGNYCDIARAVRPSVADQLSEGTKQQILRENEKLAKLCGVRP